MKRSLKSALEVSGIYLIVLIMFVVILYPLLWAFSMSLNPGTSLFSLKMIPDNWSLEHYEWLFNNPSSNYTLWYKNTLIVAVINGLASVCLVSIVAYVFSRFRFVGRKNSIYTFLLLQMFPVLMGMVAIYLLLNTVNLLDTFTGLILIYVFGGLPMNLFLVKGYLDTIPRDLDESAKIDGAGYLTIFFKILIPLASPIIAVVALFTFMAPFFDFLTPQIIIRSPEKFTLALGLYNFINDKFSNNFTMFAAGTILIAVPISIVFLLLQRFLISGLADGATKG
ncbi:arabinogalactan oligomer / maltooligosaccharide transport system permease protein [Paenibacillus catalpae]|uniref:Arabinogalactan oligomer / maltooligosaccharide transport system permease protein n=1 Tax=Paenibacillus catalpae TaxID=1045775 RepID=A0A1I2CU65_9BACL|nr:sugar ABC transporter permease [Paenibacillus catalpae]SFE71722.1 arabinogalactan oligomer / maltooligosaccharide transport system permease protein [Paenibacillus catalpae]